MTDEFNTLYETFNDFDHARRVAVTKETSVNIFKAMKELKFDDKRAFRFIFYVYGIFTSSYKGLNHKEYDFYCEVFPSSKSSYEDVKAATGKLTEATKKNIFRAIKSYNDQLKTQILLFALGVCSSDGRISKPEKRLIDECFA